MIDWKLMRKEGRNHCRIVALLRIIIRQGVVRRVIRGRKRRGIRKMIVRKRWLLVVMMIHYWWCVIHVVDVGGRNFMMESSRRNKWRLLSRFYHSSGRKVGNRISCCYFVVTFDSNAIRKILLFHRK